MNNSFFCALAVSLGLAACSSDSSNNKPDAQTPDAATGVDAGADIDAHAPTTCVAAREQLMSPIDKVSTGEVITLSNADGVRTIFVDASAGGVQAQASNPRVYINLETGTRVDTTDIAALSRLDWDLAVKRPILFTNSGDAGPGQGSAVQLEGKDFDDVTAADASSLSYAAERFFDTECAPKLDPTNAMQTSFTGWYDYDTSTSQVIPKSDAWVVRGATGKLYKVAIVSFYANPDGSTGQAGGRYTLKIKALQ